MKRKILYNWSALLLVLIVINLFLFKYGITLPENPEDYCATRTIISEASCIADLPGQFGTGAIRVLSLFLFLMYPILHAFYVGVRKITAWLSRLF